MPRMPTLNEILRDRQLRHHVGILKLSNGIAARVIATLQEAERELEERLRSQLTAWGRASAQAALADIRALIAKTYRIIGRELRADLHALAAYESDFQRALLASGGRAIAVRIGAGLSLDALATIVNSRPFQGRLLRTWAATLESDAFRRVRVAIRQSVTLGESIDQAVRRIRGTREGKYRNGILSISRRDAEAVTRTAISHVSESVSDAIYGANADVLRATRWTSTLDLSTTPGCIERDSRLYHPITHKALDGGPPWGAGPGRLHWRAVCAGTPVRTDRGVVPVASVAVGDRVLTHSGAWRGVLAIRSKPSEGGVVRAVHTQAGRVLRATDDHPVLTAGEVWKFVGALEVGDQLLGDPEQVGVVVGGLGEFVTASEYGPAVADEPQVALQRTIKLAATTIDFNGDQQLWYGEIEDRAAGLILSDPSAISDQSRLHHLLALAHALQKLGRHGLGNLLAHRIGHSEAAHASASLGVGAVGDLGFLGAFDDAGHAAGVVGGHAGGVGRHDAAGFLGEAPGPMLTAGLPLDPAGGEVESRLSALATNRDVVVSGVVGQAAIGEAMSPLDRPQRVAGLDVLGEDQWSERRISFSHDPIVALEVQYYNGVLFDLEVEGDCSYLASGVVVSNCRSTSIPISVSARELGADGDERTRASMNGQVPAHLNYRDWLRTQPAAIQDQVLGRTRGRLFRSGAIEDSELFRVDGRFRSVAELRAFEEAA